MSSKNLEFASRLLTSLIEPTSSVSGKEARLKARLLSGLILISMALYLSIIGILSATKLFSITWYDVGGVICLGLCYWLSRTAFHHYAVPIFIVVALLWALLQTADDPDSGNLIAFAIIFAGMFSTPLVTFLTAVLGIAGFVLLAVDPALSHLPIQSADVLVFLIPLTGLILVQSFLTRRAWRRAENSIEQLAASEQHYRQLFEHNSAVQLLIDPDNGQIVQASPAACQFYGYNAEQMKALRISNLNVLSPADTQAQMRLAVQEKRNIFEFQHRLASGEIRDVISFAGTATIGDKTYLYSIIQDVTEHQKMQKSLRDRENTIRALVEQSHEGIMITDDQGLITEWNAAIIEITDLPRSEALGRPLWDVLFNLQPDSDKSPAAYDQIRRDNFAILNATATDATAQVIERNIVRKDGTHHVTQTSRFLIQSDTGNHLVGIMRDITEHRQMINALAASEAQFRAFVEQSSDGITLIDDLGRVIEWNAAQELITELNHEEALGRFIWDIQYQMIPYEKQTPGVFANIKAQILGIMSNDQSAVHNQPMESELYAKNGTLKYVQQTIFPIQSVTGHRIAAVSRDITEHKQAQQREFDLALEKERGQLLRSFIRQASHEFRTPLTIIYSAAFLAARSEDPEKRLNKAAKIEYQVQRMTKLVDTLLKMTELENSAEHAPVPVNINSIFNAVHKKTVAVYGETPAVHWHSAANLPTVMADAEDLTEAVYQIVDNAYRFTPVDGMITVSTGVENNQVYLSISDTGPGISETSLPHIFETFWRQDEAHTTPGLGLGLPIAKKIIEKFGGTIKVESEVAKGSTFTIMMPIANNSPAYLAQ
jgi:PAS domain S-box-containing protein